MSGSPGVLVVTPSELVEPEEQERRIRFDSRRLLTAPSCTAEATPALCHAMAVGRSRERLCSRARVTGVAFFDFKHGQTGVAPNAIELHPILGFHCLTGSWQAEFRRLLVLRLLARVRLPRELASARPATRSLRGCQS
jgi:hypothetical protein